MRYYLDFDRTLFDTDAFKAWLVTDRNIPLAEVEARCNEGTLTFAPGELARFLYPDAAAFLREKENAVTIITFGNRELQERKAQSALFGIPRMSVMYTGDTRKGNYLAPHTHLHAGAVLVDDTPLELEILATECPGLPLYEMRRDGREGDGRWPVIRSLAELP